ncbi:hypothetical protein GCM10010260_34740 [Streptomyces filipinensis]|uniref:Secreted protein n=1 Tax=Streptomyces filipinensis TaxID=66887 RepID=A0A918MC22_9ACTN|nr:hypothetical protein GCM10010260_34740 [Streptomyces filipinensis]
MKLTRLGFIAAMGAAVVGFTAGPASASGVIYSSEGGASVGFDSSSQYVTVWDEKADGHAAVGRVYYQGKLWFTLWNTKGAHTSEMEDSLVPRGAIRVEACIGNKGKVLAGSCVSRPDKS